MPETDDRQELERRLQQARRIAREPNDSVTTEQLAQLLRELKEQLR
jgi:hypothetical protein